MHSIWIYFLQKKTVSLTNLIGEKINTALNKSIIDSQFSKFDGTLFQELYWYEGKDEQIFLEMLMNCSSKARGIDMDQYNIGNQGTLFVGKMWPPIGTQIVRKQKHVSLQCPCSSLFRTSLQLIIDHKLQPRSLGTRRTQWSEEQHRLVNWPKLPQDTMEGCHHLQWVLEELRSGAWSGQRGPHLSPRDGTLPSWNTRLKLCSRPKKLSF